MSAHTHCYCNQPLPPALHLLPSFPHTHIERTHRIVSDMRHKEIERKRNIINPRSYDLPRQDDQGMLDEVLYEFEDSLRMLYEGYTSQVGSKHAVHDQRNEGTFAALAAEKSTIGFTEFGRIAADFKMFKPVYFREAKIAVLERAVENVIRHKEDVDSLASEGSGSEFVEVKEVVLRFSSDGSLPVDRKLIKPMFQIEAARSAGNLGHETVSRLHNWKDLGHVLADIAYCAKEATAMPPLLSGQADTNVVSDTNGGDDEADPLEIKIRVLFELLANKDEKVELVELCEALAESDEADELLMGNDKWRFPEFRSADEENELLGQFMTIDECLLQFRVQKGDGAGVASGGLSEDKGSWSSAPSGEGEVPGPSRQQRQPGWYGSKAELAKALFLRMRMDDIVVLEKVMMGFGRGMTFFTGREGNGTKYVHMDTRITDTHGASHPVHK